MNTATILVALDFVTVGIFALLVVAGVRDRNRPGASIASWLWFVLAAVAASFVGGRLNIVSDQSAVNMIFLGWVGAVSLWAGFVFSYTNRGPTLTRRGTAMATCYVVVVALTTLYSTTLAGTADGATRIVIAVLQTLLLGVGLFSVFLVVRSGQIDTGISGLQALPLSIGGLSVTLLLFTVSILNVSDPETLPAIVSVVLLTSALAFAVSIFGCGLFDGAPAAGPLARQSLLDQMREAVVVTDRERRLVDANETAARTFDIALEADAGRPAASVLGTDLETAGDEPVTMTTVHGARTFAVRRSELTSHRGETVGRSYLFEDVTDKQTRRQRLEVLERVLRHNLRNDLDAISGFAEALSDGLADDPGVVADRIDSLASELVDVGETVERADRIMAREVLAYESVDISALARSVVTEVGHEHEVESSVCVVGENFSLRTDPDVLRAALREVVENAVEHSDKSDPEVRIAVAGTGDTGEIAVRDDGPGIPDRERRVLLDGEEDPLRHGSGVGLWFVSWAITRLGGDLTLSTPDRGGSEVILTIPDHRETDGGTVD